ncbi:hypothetical protein NDA16_000687 [Ustilago loliicola]|nr:hypothetical protein NDA16_000687 [Ustilago loliicola]
MRSQPTTQSNGFVADVDLRETNGWSTAVHLIQLVDSQIQAGWNKYTALITLGLQQQDDDLVHALHGETSTRGGLSAYVSYGSQLTAEQALEAIKRIGDFPFLAHLPEADTELVGALVNAAKKGDIPQDALPFHPELNHFQASMGPVKAKSVSIFMYASIEAKGDASIWACAFPFSHHTKDFAFQDTATDSQYKVGEEHRSAAAMSYSRTLALLKSTMGPRFPLEQLWDQHTYFEFADRDSAKTMSTMVAQLYVNHVACLTGGAGFVQLARFYEHHFTCKKLRIPMVGIVNLRGDKLAYESLYWDQANALVQLGLLDPVKSSLKQGVNLPIAGDQVVQKILHPYGVPSNELMPNWSESEGKAVPATTSKSQS